MPEQAPVTSITVWEHDLPDMPPCPQEYVGATVARQEEDGSLVLLNPPYGAVGAVAPGQWARYRYNRDETATPSTQLGDVTVKVNVDTAEAEQKIADLTAKLPGPRLEYVHSDGTRTEIDTADLSELPARERALAKTLVREARLNLDKLPKPKQPAVASFFNSTPISVRFT